MVEGRGSAEGNAASETRPGRSAGDGVSSELDRVRQMAREGQGSAVHRASASRRLSSGCEAAYRAISPGAAPGVDGVTWRGLRAGPGGRTSGICTRGSSAARYRAKPSRRAYIPKPDGRLRPLGVAALEDKIVQRAVVEVLNGIYEEDFLGFSYGFRPGRSAA